MSTIYYESNDTLYHHGIKGQKWGVRRFQNKDGSLTNAGRKRVQGSHKTGTAGMSDAATYLLSEAAVFATMFGVAKVASAISVKSMRKKLMTNLEERKNNRSISSFETCPKLKKPMSASESMKLTNPDFPSDGTTMNCTFCTTAMALREKGYDVVASKSPSPWHTEDLFNKTFNSPMHKMSSKEGKNLVKTLSNNGDGAYGNLAVNWKLGGGHSIFWKNENGTTRIYDGQDGSEITKSTDNYDKFIKSIQTNSVVYNRLDNCEPTEYALAIVEKRKG